MYQADPLALAPESNHCPLSDRIYPNGAQRELEYTLIVEQGRYPTARVPIKRVFTPPSALTYISWVFFTAILANIILFAHLYI